MTQGFVAIALVVALAVAVAGIALRSRRWFAGRPARVDVWRGLLRLPRSYFVDVHDVVAGDAYAARMHVATAGGFAAALSLIVLVHVFGLGGRVLAAALLAALAVMTVGAGLVAARRLGGVPARLSRGGFSRLPASLFVFSTVFALVTLPAAGLAPREAWGPIGGAVALSVGIWACLEMIAGAPFGPMKHALYGTLHLICHPRFARFGAAAPDAALAPLDLGDGKLGTETPRDFAWNRLLGFDACVECGRCEEACPAFAAGLPLNPKKLIRDLAAATGLRASDAGYRGSAHPGQKIGTATGGCDVALVGDGAMVARDSLWACTTCRACVDACPMMIEHVDAVIELRRFETLERGATPGKGAEVLEELRAADNPGGHPLASRLDWAADLALPSIGAPSGCDVLLWLGDGAFEARNQRTLRALVRLFRRAGVDFAVLGADELDCGDLARRLGDEASFQDLARRNVATLAGHRFNRIVTADPHVLHCLRNEYPAFGGRYEVTHHTTFLAALVESGALTVARLGGGRVSYHDPCYLARYNGETDAPRRLLAALGADLVEMERSGLGARCCGGGGGAPVTDVVGARRIPDLRMDDARATGAATVAVACPNCAIMLEGVTGPRPEVVDIAELLLAAVEDAT